MARGPVKPRPPAGRVLLVGADSPEVRKLADLLTAEGGEVVRAQSVAEALEAPGRYDRALLEYELSDGSGILLAATLLVRGQVDTIGFVLPPMAAGSETSKTALSAA